ncbi:hypothetical protein NE645_17955, partial [Roseburia hominis]|nr:hypothetical protein [Roseburia hominis]
EKGLKLDIEVKNVYEHASSFLPLEKTDVNSENDFGNLFKHGLVLEELHSTPDSLKNGFKPFSYFGTASLVKIRLRITFL